MKTGVMTNIAEAQLIALDWGTTSARAYLMGRGGSIVANRSASLGIMQVAAQAKENSLTLDAAFEQALAELCGEWMETYPLIPVIACGMIGSQQGWVEATYRAVPANLAAPEFELASVEISPGRRMHVIPGVLDLKTLPDVMRGEETQILGAVELGGTDSRSEMEQLFLLPGTHSKWVKVQGRTITEFSTSMTGETFALLSSQSILSKMIESSESVSWIAFERGVQVSQSANGAADLMLTAFSARTLVLTGRLQRTEVSDYLSGLMIGAEIRSVIGAWDGSVLPPLTICGNKELSARYRRALKNFGITEVRELQGTAPRGVWAVACALGLLQASPV
ncbi:2-dehydro-3-deoxygalactonokinase [Arthrobacter sp. MYb211]|nr:2-dehydro-3-deoxygalactonokinase [Arthrobacter sp. MYb229]PRA10217.1 2-dehydro-3-deoxygalactonokinase [Arthrobacter sp. MYb221]PRB51720.1 2-dehydro-3-deoxygalactonokinase [Arthrobacter sp. MYb216]PRC05596.1 2-dehydro-3-deoxygalactonokinase [Arthrobacter sp. MYb211]